MTFIAAKGREPPEALTARTACLKISAFLGWELRRETEMGGSKATHSRGKEEQKKKQTSSVAENDYTLDPQMSFFV